MAYGNGSDRTAGRPAISFVNVLVVFETLCLGKTASMLKGQCCAYGTGCWASFNDEATVQRMLSSIPAAMIADLLEKSSMAETESHVWAISVADGMPKIFSACCR